MTGELREKALAALGRKLGLDDETADETALGDALEAAEEDILRCLGRPHLPKYVRHLLVELAALKYERARGGGSLKRESYSEGQISKSEDYFTPAEVHAQEAALLGTLAPYRRVRCGRDRHEAH